MVEECARRLSAMLCIGTQLRLYNTTVPVRPEEMNLIDTADSHARQELLGRGIVYDRYRQSVRENRAKAKKDR
jgi:hypothetical protein